MDCLIYLIMIKKENNRLFPIFLQLERLSLLIIGGGKTALEKLKTVLRNNPDTEVNLIAYHIDQKVYELAKIFNSIRLTKKVYGSSDLKNMDVIIIAVNDPMLSKKIKKDAKKMHKLVNVSDVPELCDFYLGSIVQKGNLKIAISTNGKSPTMAKRLKEIFSEVIPYELDEVLINMDKIRKKLKGDFDYKVEFLNTLTRKWLKNPFYPEQHKKKFKNNLFKLVVSLVIMCCLFLSHIDIKFFYQKLIYHLDISFLYLVITGFFAQLVDGAIGMGYGLTCTTILLTLGIPLSSISASIHTAEIFSSGISGLSHYKMGNVNKKLFKILLVPGVIGSIFGAFLLSKYGDSYAFYIKPMLAFYTFFLGIRILLTAWRKKPIKAKRIGLLAGFGGFLDSFVGGGWGPFVTSTLISKGRTPKYVIGSVSLSEFFVTLSSTLTFFYLLGIHYWKVVFGLVFGGFFAAPIAAKISGKLPLKIMCFSIGFLVIIWSIRVLYNCFFNI
ncbi:TSUP family transporter [Blattabacterium cuenoti]|uniref:TSUP family transporter n=1 Tax=Blattabacterium cuenoti TaxID=1653831 RepID=UPI001EEBE8A0|nr:TSUP family transporter [Blattabacterium cuenoti]